MALNSFILAFTLLVACSAEGSSVHGQGDSNSSSIKDDVVMLQIGMQHKNRKELHMRKQKTGQDSGPGPYKYTSDALTASQRNIFCFMVVLGLLALGWGVYPRASDSNVKKRDGRWDVCKFWCMMCVVYIHSHEHHWGKHPYPRSIVDDSGRSLSLLNLCKHSGIPGFTLISGVMTASAVELKGDAIVINRQSIRNSLRDLVLNTPTVTALQLVVMSIVLLAAGEGGAKPWMDFYDNERLTPLVQVPLYWYLGSLFLWRLFIPVLVQLRWPVLSVSVCAALCRFGSAPTWSNPSLSMSPFFILGFVLGGGGSGVEERKARLNALNSWLVHGRVRIAAIVLLALYFIVATQVEELPEILARALSKTVSKEQDLPTPWKLGGPLSDLLWMACTVGLNLAIFVVLFALPSSPMLSAAGSRTLYVYILHKERGFDLANGDFQIACDNLSERILQPFGVPINFIGQLVYIFFVVLFLGSRFIEDFTHHFISPEWLADILCGDVEPKSNQKSNPKT